MPLGQTVYSLSLYFLYKPNHKIIQTTEWILVSFLLKDNILGKDRFKKDVRKEY